MRQFKETVVQIATNKQIKYYEYVAHKMSAKSYILRTIFIWNLKLRFEDGVPEPGHD